MSLRVMVVVEDPTYDRYIVQPLVQVILADLGRESARVDVLANPHIRGIEDAIHHVPAVVSSYPQYDVFVLALDRDGEAGRAARLNDLRKRIEAGTETAKPLICCLAQEEVETWLLAAQWTACRRAHPRWRWADVRGAVDVKERYFQPFFLEHRNMRLPGQGRAQLMSDFDLGAVMDKCPELGILRQQLKGVLTML